MFVTNNSTLSRKNYVKKFEKLGIHASEKDIFSSSFATAVYLRNILNFPKDKRVFVIGESGIVDELREVGIETCGASVRISFSSLLPLVLCLLSHTFITNGYQLGILTNPQAPPLLFYAMLTGVIVLQTGGYRRRYGSRRFRLDRAGSNDRRSRLWIRYQHQLPQARKGIHIPQQQGTERPFHPHE